MKPFSLGNTSTGSYGGALEKIEIMRSTLRWASTLEREQVQRLLGQCNQLREEVMKLSHTDRLAQSPDIELESPSRSRSQRREALLERDFIFEGVFGESPQLLEALEIAEKAAPTDLPVLIGGESGTGKELMAKVIHANGGRSDRAFVSVNCGAIPDNLIESELFGHKRGAFTGASSDRKGRFESAHEGTIFLDEIGELPLSGQVKLLRVLQSHEIQRVGSDEVIEVDTRVVAATNRNLLEMSRQGTFREDLYYRLGVIEVTLPPLRERQDEIPLLIEFFSNEAAEQLDRRPIVLSARLRRFLQDYAYPGNVRELRNIIFRVACLAADTADVTHLPVSIRPELSSAGPQAADDDTIVRESSLGEVKKAASDEAERRFLESGLGHVGGRVAELARQIDMNRSHLQTLLKKHGIRSKDFRAAAAEAET